MSSSKTVTVGQDSVSQTIVHKDLVANSPEIIAANNSVVYLSRILMTSIAGSVCGILGVTGWGGFAFFAISSFLLSLLMLFRVGFKTKTYFDSAMEPWTGGVFQGLLTFILFWTLMYDMVHVYS